VFTIDRDWRITSFNRAAERITGISASQAIGKNCSEVFHADICEQGCAIRQTLDTGRDLIDVRAKILNSRGQAIPISLSTAVLRDRDGSLLGAVETFRDLSAIEQLRREIEHQYTLEDIVGKSKAFKKIFAILPDVAESGSTILIEGPSGSGKELLARAIHNLSPRRKQPYVVVNCGTLPPNLFESELFGYLKGAFTDAKKDKAGRVALAEGGTILFDEISELPLVTQVKLLRLLQEREYEPLGGVKPIHADVRVMAATNQKLLDMVSQGKFRDDLYFRLAVVRVSIPSLSERREDIPYLVEHFIDRFNARRGKKLTGVTADVMQFFMRHEFPGNVRELENLIEHGFVLCHQGTIGIEHLPEDVQYKARGRRRKDQDDGASIEEPISHFEYAEAETIKAALCLKNGHLERTARELGISRTTLWRKMKKSKVDAAEFRSKSDKSFH
jgi:PAS domain S-box-containing protein